MSRKRTARADPEQMSMFYFNGVDARAITEFTWHKVEKRLNELQRVSLLESDDAGIAQVSPVRPRSKKRDLYRQMEDVVVLAISANNYACQRDVPYQFRYSLSGKERADELYMVKKQWTRSEIDSWTTSPAFRRQHLCSLQGPWDWSDGKVLRVPFSHGAGEGLAEGRYEVNIDVSRWMRDLPLLHSHFHLRLQGYTNGYRLLLLGPDDLRLVQRAWLSGIALEDQRCVEARDLVERFISIFEGEEGRVEEWEPIRDQRAGEEC